MIDYRKLKTKYMPSCKKVTKVQPICKKKFLKSHGKPSKKRNIELVSNSNRRTNSRKSSLVQKKSLFSGRNKSHKTEACTNNKRTATKSQKNREDKVQIEEVRRIKIGDLVRIEYTNGDFYFGQVFRDLPHGNGNYCSK